MECSWLKTYLGRHSVEYYGHREGKGIWGTWNIRRARGGFQIWPIGSEPAFEDISEEEDSELPALLEITTTGPNHTVERTSAGLVFDTSSR
jgi:hypothetical protein